MGCGRITKRSVATWPTGAVALSDRRPIRAGRAREVALPLSSVFTSGSAFAGFRIPADVIVVAVRWYLRYGLSYRDVEELLAERGVEVDHVTIYRWVQRFTPLLADEARLSRLWSASIRFLAYCST